MALEACLPNYGGGLLGFCGQCDGKRYLRTGISRRAYGRSRSLAAGEEHSANKGAIQRFKPGHYAQYVL